MDQDPERAQTAAESAQREAQEQYQWDLEAWEQRKRSARWKVALLYVLMGAFAWALVAGVQASLENGVSIESVIVFLVLFGLVWWPLEVAKSVKRRIGRRPEPPV